ncbi:MAG: hypothetical protein HQK75_20370 [Candidatus Magnetomorum sp.]|nr:hypothetical protein [Candidatus Magnetomorum sp.]
MLKTQFVKLFFLIFFVFLTVQSVVAKETTRILLIPFAIYPESEVSLSTSIHNTMAFSLMQKPDIRVIYSDVSWQSSDLLTSENQRKLVQIAKEKQCSYAIYGSANMFGKRISLGAVLMNVSDQKIVHSSSGVLNVLDDAPKWLNTFLDVAIGQLIPDTPLNPAKQQKKKTTETHILNIDDEIIGMDVADIDDDSQNEILLYTPKHVLVFEKDFTKAGSYNSSFGKTIVHAKWVSATAHQKKFLILSETSGSESISTLYHWKAGTFISVQSYHGWFFSTLPSDNQSQIIIGQKRQYSDYRGSIMSMTGPLEKLVPQPFALPVPSNIFYFSFAHQSLQPNPLFINFEDNDRLNIYSGNSLLWRSHQPLGGSLHYIDVQKDTGDINTSVRKFMPSALLICDIDKDHDDELIVCENDYSKGNLFEKNRWFSEGVVHVLKWTGTEMKTLWTSKKQPGPVTAYAIEQNNSVCKIWMVCVLNQRSLFRNGLSRMVVYDIDME